MVAWNRRFRRPSRSYTLRIWRSNWRLIRISFARAIVTSIQRQMCSQAIQAVEGLQTQTGGFTMWPGMVAVSGESTRGRSNVDEWATAYAVHFLAESQEAGYEVRASVLSSAIDFLTTYTNSPTTENAVTFDEAGTRTLHEVASRTSIYSLYALAVAGKPNRSAMNFYKQNSGLLTSDSPLSAGIDFLPGWRHT